jgi:hypothetical protein
MSYQPPAAVAGALRLHYNENTAGCSPAVVAALGAISREDAAFYPDYSSVTTRVERAFGVSPGWVQLTNGLDEGLQVVAMWARNAHTASADVIITEPAFEMYDARTEAVNATLVRVPTAADFGFPLERLLSAITSRTRLIYLTDPNNPTGLPIPAGAVETTAQAAPQALVLVDEAYADFSGRTSIGPLGAGARGRARRSRVCGRVRGSGRRIPRSDLRLLPAPSSAVLAERRQLRAVPGWSGCGGRRGRARRTRHPDSRQVRRTRMRGLRPDDRRRRRAHTAGAGRPGGDPCVARSLIVERRKPEFGSP